MPFRVTLIVFTTALTVIVAGSILTVVYVQGQRAADRQAARTFDLAASTVEQRLTTLVDGTGDVVDLGANSAVAAEAMSEPETAAEVVDFMRAMLDTDPALYSVYFGGDDGTFTQLVRIDDGALAEQLGAPGDASHMLREVVERDGLRVDHRRFLDSSGDDVADPIEAEATYDPRTRPWYTGASETPELFVTAPYVFDSTGEPGVTLARSTSDGVGVFGADLTLTDLQEFVGDLSVSDNSSVYVFDDDGGLWVSSGEPEPSASGDSASGDQPSAPEALTALAASGSNDVGSDGDRLARVSTWESPAGATVHIGIVAPRSDFTGFVRDATERIAIIVPIVLALGIVVIWLVSRSISRPLRLLTARADRVSRFAFDDAEERSSFVTEIDSLSGSFSTMTTALREYIHAIAASHLRLETLIDTGIALTVERDADRLYRRVLDDARALTHAASAAVVKVESDGSLRVTHRSPAGSPGVVLESSAPSDTESTGDLVRRAVTRRSAQNDAIGTADDGGGVMSRLAVPVLDRNGDVDCVLVLVDATDAVSGRVVAFSRELEGFVTVAASQAAAALDSAELLLQQRRLVEAIIELVAGAIDAKSPYTAGHCNRVPQLALWLVDAASASAEPEFEAFELDATERYEFRIAAWLHDCGKVTTPEYVVDKATKLETIYNRVHEVRTRFEVLLRDARIEVLEARLDGESASAAEARFERIRSELVADFEFIATANIGGEFLEESDQERIRAIAARTWTRNFDDRIGLSPFEEHLRAGVPDAPVPATEPLLADKPWHKVPRRDGGRPWGDNPHGFTMAVPEWEYDHGEITNLAISRGTLTPEERFKINDHIVQTINMLEQLPLPPSMERVPEIAGGHHERMDGKGYPKGLTRDEMSISARIVAIADVFEALTAADRPYKPAKPLSESLAIMRSMCDNDHIDPDLFDLFLRSGIVERYADEFLSPDQLDVLDIPALARQPT